MKLLSDKLGKTDYSVVVCKCSSIIKRKTYLFKLVLVLELFDVDDNVKVLYNNR